MELRDITIRAAKRIVADWHRHLDKPQGAKFAIAAWKDGRLVATDGTPNACSFLYTRAKRAAQALGFKRVLTKTLPEESGASLRAVAAKCHGLSRGGSWDRVNRRRAEKAPTQQKVRWEL